jgi:hypothetical protein
MKLSLPFRILNLISMALFALFSWVQWNDVDPAVYDRPSILDAVLWGLFYALIAVLFALMIFRPAPRWLLIVTAVFCLIEMGRTAPGVWNNLAGDEEFTMTQASMSAEDPRVELTREFFGAVIALVGVGFLAWECRRFYPQTAQA